MDAPSNADVIRAWSDAADHVADFDDDGDFARKHLLNPAIFGLLGDVRGRRILDAGCGQGYLCRLLARKGAVVTGVEPAEPWYRHAVERELEEHLGIVYIQEDLSALSSAQNRFAAFDHVIANMVLMDIPDFEAAMGTCIAFLEPGGSLIFSLVHPCFEEDAAAWGGQGFVAVRDYLHQHTIPQTFAAPRFHRPLSRYLYLAIQHGCELRQIIEPQLGPEWAERGPQYARNVYVPSFIVVHATRA
jgi:2-polyprenyl-3-methyl-5-hydroxy-6-metoxy-1,4-benzoquinol methylase